MDAIDKLALKADLINSRCELAHKDESPKATNQIICPMGEKRSGKISSYITIPICSTCEDALNGGEYTLFFCTKCGSSAWRHKKLARREYEKIEWFNGCPNCLK